MEKKVTTKDTELKVTAKYTAVCIEIGYEFMQKSLKYLRKNSQKFVFLNIMLNFCGPISLSNKISVLKSLQK